MGEQQRSRISMMNFREQLLGQKEKEFQMNNAWVPVTPEKLFLMGSHPISDRQENQMRRANCETFPVHGSDYMVEMLHYNGPDQNLHLIGQTGQTGGHNNFHGSSADRSRNVNHTAGSYTDALQYESNGLNSNPLEFLFKKNATNMASANRNLDMSISMAARSPVLSKYHPQASSEARESYAGVQRCNINSSSDTLYIDADQVLIQNRNSEFDGSNSDSLLDNDVNCSLLNTLKDVFSEIPHGDSYMPYRAMYDLDSAPITEAYSATSFTNSLQSMPKTMDQFKFVDNQLCVIPEYATAENTSQKKDNHENLVSPTANEIQEYCHGLLQHIEDSSSAAITTPYRDRQGSESNICGSETDLGFDLNKTPEQKAPKRRKHRPKVIVEGKPKRSPNPATRKTQVKENPPKKRKNVTKAAAATQSDVIKETLDSSATTRKSCRRALNFDLDKSMYESQSRVVCQQEIHHRNDKAFNTTSDYKASEMIRDSNMMHGTNSALLISQQEGLTVENQQPRNTDDNTLLLNQKLTDTFLSERKETVALSAATEEQLIAKLPVTEKGAAQRNPDLCNERNNRCTQKYIHANEIGNVLFQSETSFENAQKTRELMCQNTFHLVPNNLSNSTEGRGSKRKYCHSTENQHVSATDPLAKCLYQEILQVDENFHGETIDKGFLETQKRKKTQKRLHAKGHGKTSSQIMTKDDSQKVRIKDKNGSQSQANKELPNFDIESKRFVEQQNNVASSADCFPSSGEPHQIYSFLIDEIIYRLKGLDLMESNMPGMEGQMALVPYKGDRSVVLHQGFAYAKKHKPRPKVDLDPETQRTWKLLMGKEGSEGLEGSDKEKEKWWEEERSVFHGRADSFIARMHLVQGDRRFSKWKGSVVDSVIGVFLTQNVSDHLSSSAFMSLASRFPLESKSSNKSYEIVGTSTLLEEPEFCIVNPDDTTILYGRGTLSQPTHHLGFVTPHPTRELWRDREISSLKRSLINPNNQSSDEEVLSSQDSLDSSITQGTRGIRSCSASNSESESPNSWCEPSKTRFLTPTKSLQVGKTTMFQEFYNSVNGVSLFDERTKDAQVQQREHTKQGSTVGRGNSHNWHSAFSHPSNFGYPYKQIPVVSSTDYELHYSGTQGPQTSQILGEESSWPDTVSILSQDNNYRFGTRETEKQYGPLGSPELPTINSNGPSSKHLVILEDISQSISYPNHNQTSPTYHLVGQKTIQPEGTPCTESLNTYQVLGEGQHDGVNDFPKIPMRAEGLNSGKIISAANRYSDNSRAEPKRHKQIHSSGPTYKESKLKVSKARKVKSETDKKNAGDWDKLRKEVQANGTKMERSKDTMDSLNYEAVRCALVKDISDAIKERGMNNMLAERIKEFLNRLIEEHGSIDLEWLRHVPPDKAKDYLLSIRGLGLKSVECVRLLTLHHVAFPVDTNVGRIAVRLGWVPLQPLPESLQLHLLELYPVLESIQKYLWPRLCKLDQKTLYELHYQMITFGKVFCTKNKPNCNACPMRAECRHFASAFASARLALPAPAEKGIVSTHVPIAAERNPSINMNPLILPLPENNSTKEASPESGKCEPIIEEPATPEQERTEALESDMEDLFGEDPDEIPIIEVNIEEFAMNVRNCMQYNELQEGDMSKALVALTPQSACLPTQKLKNVSRLRTEHQVYELPDSHPLLEKMDKRESDDPSPYLLAIWTPGETANSIAPPERRCGSQDSTNLCNDHTCFSCNSIREANSHTVRGTLLIPCRTATRGSFPLNGTYFQVNEVFADHASSIQPLDIPRAWIWNLPRRTVYFGTSVSSIFKGLSTQGIQHCFWRGFVCVRGFDQQTHAPRPLKARFHFPASKLAKTKK